MESKFPKKAKTFKVGDKVICVDKKHEGWYMVKGVVKHVGPTPKSKDKDKIGVEFEKNILKKVKTVFKTKPGHGAYVDEKNLLKYTKDFDVVAFKKHFEKKKKPKKKKPKEKVIEIATDQEEDMEESKMTQSNNLAESQVIQDSIKSVNLDQQQKNILEIQSEKKQKIKVEAPIPKQNDFSQLNATDNNEQVKQLIEENTKLEEERKKIYVEFKKIQIENTKHLYDKQNLEQQLKDANLKIKLIEQNYNDLKDNQNNENTKDTINNIQEQQLQEITNLKVQNSSLQDQLKTLQQKIEEFNDYEEFKKKLEQSTINQISLEQEKKNLQEIIDKQKLELDDIKERYEIFQLEGEVVARDDHIPDDDKKLRENYQVLLKAFENLDIDYEIQKEEYEHRIIKLNEKVAELNQKRTNIFAIEEVRKLVDRKDNEIKELYQLVDQYSQSNKMVEKLTEQIQQKDENYLKLKESVDITTKRMVYLQEENQLLDEIMNELEENLELEQQKNFEQIQQKEELQNKFEKLKLDAEKYEQKIQILLEEKQDLAFQTSQLDEDKQQISSINFEFTKAAQIKQGNFKENIIKNLNSKKDYWELTKYQIYFKSIPTKMQVILQMQMFDKLKNLYIAVTQMDLIQESLCTQFLFDNIIQDENLNLYGTARDVFNEICLFQKYTNILIEEYLKVKDQQELKQLIQSQLHISVVACLSQINEIFQLIKDNEFSPQIVFSLLSETNQSLNKQNIQVENYECQNVQVKILLNKIYGQAVNDWISKKQYLQQIDIKKRMMSELFYISRETHLINFEQNDIYKLTQCSESLPECIGEFKTWLNNIYKKMEQKCIDSAQQQIKLQDKYWKKDIQKLNDQLEKFEEMEKNQKLQSERIEKYKEIISTKTHEIETFRDQKLKLDSKIMKQQVKLNRIATLESEIQELKKIEQSQQKKIEQLQNRETSDQNLSKKNEYKKRPSIQQRFSTMKNQTQRQNNLLGMVSLNSKANQSLQNLNIEYKPREKFEINSLNAIVQNLINQLVYYKSQLCKKYLDTFQEQTPSFQILLMDQKQKNQIQTNNLHSTVKYLKNTQYVIKNKISKMKVLLNGSDEIKQNYTHLNNMINCHYINSKNILEQCVKRSTDKYNHQYDIDYKRQLTSQREQKLQNIYGKLKLLDQKKPEDLKGKQLYTNIQIQ